MDIQLQEGVHLAPYTTFGVGGPARFFVNVTTCVELQSAVQYASEHDLPIFVLGGGSNVLIDDSGFDGLVIYIQLKGVTYTDNSVRAAAGEEWDALVIDAIEHGYAGLEHLSGIPGTVGGAVVQNIGAYGVELAHICANVTVFDRTTASVEVLNGTSCEFGYRTSIFITQPSRYIVLEAEFTLDRRSISFGTYQSLPAEASVQEMRTHVLAARQLKGMLKGQHRSAGSFFKNCIVSPTVFEHIQAIVHQSRSDVTGNWYWKLPTGNYKVATALLMEMTEFNKTDYIPDDPQNGASISPQHTLSLVAHGNASTADVLSLATRIQKKLHTLFNVHVVFEVQHITTH